MKILFLTLATFPGITERGIYTDLLREFRDCGHEVCVVCPRERRTGGKTELVNDGGVRILRVHTWNLTQASLVEKALGTLLIKRQFRWAIDSLLGDVDFDLVLYSTPPITFDRLVAYLKRKGARASYLLLKDIFPQNAVDLGMMRSGGLAWQYFRARERRLYAASEWIGCMSEANVKYVLDHNPQVSAGNVEVCPNAVEPLPVATFSRMRLAAREWLGLCEEDVVFLYGGNFGKPQGIDFIIECAKRCSEIPGALMLLVGSGTEYWRIHQYQIDHPLTSLRLLPSVSRDEYDVLLSAADVGLVFLDHRFTIPNFPSRLTGYMEAGLPILAATDRASDVGDVLRSADAGFWVPSDDADAFIEAVRILTCDRELRRHMGAAARNYLESHYTVRLAYETIMSHMGGHA